MSHFSNVLFRSRFACDFPVIFYLCLCVIVCEINYVIWLMQQSYEVVRAGTPVIIIFSFEHIIKNLGYHKSCISIHYLIKNKASYIIKA